MNLETNYGWSVVGRAQIAVCAICSGFRSTGKQPGHQRTRTCRPDDLESELDEVKDQSEQEKLSSHRRRNAILSQNCASLRVSAFKATSL